MRLKHLMVAGAMAVAGLGGMLLPGSAMALTCPEGTAGAGRTDITSLAQCSISSEHATEDLFTSVDKIINVVLGVLGIVAVVVIVIGGVSFVTSQGDAAKVTKARNTIIYGVVGLVIALLAFAIVNFVLKAIFK